MALQANATMRFDDYSVDDTGIHFHFTCASPGPGQVSDYYVLLTFAELTGIGNLAALRTFLIARLQRNLRAATVAAQLDPLIGQSLVV